MFSCKSSVCFFRRRGRKFCPRRYVETVENDKASDEVKDPKKMMICTVILILVVLGMAFEKNIGIPMQTTAIIGALACVLTGCLSEKQAYLGIDWVTIFLFAGMLPLASAMDKSGADVEIPFDTPVSMNMWGFTPEYFAYAEEAFKAFLDKNAQELKSEFYIPTLVNDMINAGTATCEVLDTPAKWFGVTYADDRQMVVDKIQSLVDAGVYPSPLF